MSSLTAIFGSTEDKSQDSDKLMDLYWNRAELKKEFAGMREEKFRLQENIKKQQGVAARLQQRIDHLEDLLIDSHLGHSVLVYYQLRGLGRNCERRLAKFAEQLKQQREQKNHNSLLADWKNGIRQEIKAVEVELLEQRDSLLQREDQLQNEQRRLTSMGGFARLFRGRSVMRAIDSLAEQIELGVSEEALIVERINEIKSRQPPDHQGLDMTTKRSINLMILAFAQQLYLHFADTGIVDLVKEAGEKSVGAVNYGTRYECSQLIDKILHSAESLERGIEFADTLKKRVVMLSDDAKFAGDSDAVPLAQSISTVYKIDENGRVQKSDANLLGENYWGIAKVFSR